MPTWDQFMNERSAAGALDDADDIIVQQSGVSKETDLGTLKTYIAASLSGITASSTDTLTNKTLDSFTNTIEADTIHIQVRNDSGSPIAKGTPVYVTGYNVGQELVTVAPADASSAATMPAIGLTETELLNNSNGAVDALGRITGVDTSSYSEGDILYVSETAGALTDTAPTGTAVVQPIATVLRSNASTGVLAVSAQGVIPAGAVAASGAVMESDVDAKGDLFVATADNTVTRLPVGTNDYVLTADSAQASGVKWAAASGGVTSMRIGAADMEQPASGPGTRVYNSAVGMAIWEIPNSVNTEVAGLLPMPIPSDWSTYNAYIWYVTVDTTATGAVAASFQVRAIGNGDVGSTDTGPGVTAKTVTGGAADTCTRASIVTGQTVPTAGDIVQLRSFFARGDASDTFGSTIGVLAFEIEKAS